MAKTERLSPAMDRALRAMADADTRISWIWHRRQWVTIRGRVVKDTTLRALESRGYIASVGGRVKPGRRRQRRLTAAARAYLEVDP